MYKSSTALPITHGSLKIWMALIFALLGLPVLVYFAAMTLLEPDESQLPRIRVRIVEHEEHHGEAYVRLRFLTGAKNTAEHVVPVDRRDLALLAVGRTAELVENPYLTNSAQYPYITSIRLKKQKAYDTTVLVTACLFPFVLGAYVWARRRDHASRGRG